MFEPMPPYEPPAICQETPSACREVGMVAVTINGEKRSVAFDGPLPWIIDGTLILVLGESVTVKVGDGEPQVISSGPASAVINDEQATAAVSEVLSVGDEALVTGVPMSKAVIETTAPFETLRIAFRQPPESEHSILVVQSGYGEGVDYNALITDFPSITTAYTTTCQVLPGKLSLEHWPYAITHIALYNFAFDPKVDDLADLICD